MTPLAIGDLGTKLEAAGTGGRAPLVPEPAFFAAPFGGGSCFGGRAGGGSIKRSKTCCNSAPNDLCKGTGFAFPPKSVFGSFESTIIKDRIAGITAWFQQALATPGLKDCYEICSFLGVPSAEASPCVVVRRPTCVVGSAGSAALKSICPPVCTLDAGARRPR